MNRTNGVNRTESENAVSGLTFWLFLFLNVDFFVHLSNRLPTYGMLRPTLLLVLFISLLLFMQREKLTGIGEDPAFKAILRLLVYVIVTLPLVEWPGSVLRNNLPDFIKAIAFFYFTALILDSDRRLKIFLLVFMSCQIFRVLEPLYLNYTTGYLGSWTYLGGGEFAGRLSGAPADVISPNGLGFVIVTVIPFLHYLAWESKKKLLRLLYLVLMPLLVYALIMTMSRGAFLALCVVIWMIFIKSRHKASMIIVLFISLVGIWNNITDVQKDRYLSIFSSQSRQSSSASGRLRGWIDEIIVGAKRPIVGHGMGTSSEAKFHAGHRAQKSHNLYTEVFVEIGIIGFFLFFSFLRAIYNSFKKNSRQIMMLGLADDEFVSRLNNVFIAVFWMYVVFSLNYFGLSTYYWYLFGGLTVAFHKIYFNIPSLEHGEPKKVANV